LLPDNTNGASDWYLLDLATADELAQDELRVVHGDLGDRSGTRSEGCV